MKMKINNHFYPFSFDDAQCPGQLCPRIYSQLFLTFAAPLRRTY